MIDITRTANFSHQVAEYSETLASTYDSMKLDRMKARLYNMNRRLNENIATAKALNELKESDKIPDFSEKLKELGDLGTVRYSGRHFKEEPKPIIRITEPMIEFTNLLPEAQESQPQPIPVAKPPEPGKYT